MKSLRRSIMRIAATMFSCLPLASWAQDQHPAPVDVELAFLVDASFSIDDEETWMQRQSYAAAIANDRVLKSISSGFRRSGLYRVRRAGLRQDHFALDGDLGQEDGPGFGRSHTRPAADGIPRRECHR